VTRALATAGLLFLSAAIVVLAVANRAPVTLVLDPFGADPAMVLTLPLYALVFAALAAGVVIGGLAVSLGRRGGRGRRARKAAAPWIAVDR